MMMNEHNINVAIKNVVRFENEVRGNQTLL